MNVRDCTADDMRKALQLMMDYDNGLLSRRDVESSPYFGIISEVMSGVVVMRDMLGIPSCCEREECLRKDIEREYRRVFPLR